MIPTDSVPGVAVQPVTGAPYSAEQTTEHVQALLDGTRITQTNMEARLYRDSAGRTRTERTLLPTRQAEAVVMPGMVEITDPVAGYRYTVDPRNRTARRMAWSAPKFSTPMNAVDNQSSVGTAMPTSTNVAGNVSGRRPHPETKRESLGTQNIEGVQATGTRTTVTYPEGSFGNDRPVMTTSEVWMWPELKILVLSKNSDPRYGDTTTRVINIVRAEPDPSLFEIPEDYTVVDQPAGVISFDPAGNETVKR